MWIDLNAYQRRPLFLSDLQIMIDSLPKICQQEFRLLLHVDSQAHYRELRFIIPKGDLLVEYFALIERYLLAMIVNMIVSFGGSSLSLFFDLSDAVLFNMVEEAIKEFDLDSKKNNRKKYGVHINYVNRMNRFLMLERFKIICRDLKSWPILDQNLQYRIYEPQNELFEIEMLRRSATELSKKIFCSLDVGGNSIKGAVVSDGQIIITKEFQWYPTICRTAAEMNNPQLSMIRFLSNYTAAQEIGLSLDSYSSVFKPDASESELIAVSEAIESKGITPFSRFDAIVIGFPDIVVFNKIAGGESFKHQGMKNNFEKDYEVEFSLTSDLDNLAKIYAKEGCPVVVLNDGNATSYITSVEMAFTQNNFIHKNGMFANTVGTEMGTGFISRGGTIQHIPLEGFQHIIDLGNLYYAELPTSDIRSTKNMNTSIPGTVQKYVSQLGLFRIAMTKYFENYPEIIEELVGLELIEYDTNSDRLSYVICPKDRRADLTFWLISKLNEHNVVIEDVFRTMGKALGVLFDQDVKIFPEISTTRLISGGIMSNDIAFNLLRNELKAHNCQYEVIRLDENTSYSPLLKKIPCDNRNFNTAIGSAYIGNRQLIENKLIK